MVAALAFWPAFLRFCWDRLPVGTPLPAGSACIRWAPVPSGRRRLRRFGPPRLGTRSADWAHGKTDLGVVTREVVDGAVWVVAGGGLLQRIDPVASQVVHTLAVGPDGVDSGRLAVGAGSVWLSDAEARTLLRIDPRG